MKLIETYDPYSVIVVPFPFTDNYKTKKRPALVLSHSNHQKQTHHVTLMMITSAKNSSWPSDYLISHLGGTGLTAKSIIRQKIFTIDLDLVIKEIGKLSKADKKEIIEQINKHLDL
jgi:mRNA interferase MazF